MTTDAHPITRVLAAFDVPLIGIQLVDGNARLHHFERARRVARVRAHVADHARVERLRRGVPKAEPGTFATVRLTLVRGPRQKDYDRDGQAVALKPVLDALGPHGIVKCKNGKLRMMVGSDWIVGDREAECDYDFGQDRGPEPAVRVGVSRDLE